MILRTITAQTIDRVRPIVVFVARTLVYTNIHISVAAVCVAITASLLIGFPLEWEPLFIVFAVTLFVYTFNRFTDVGEDERNVPRRVAFINRWGKYWLILASSSYVVGIGLAFAWDPRGGVILSVPLIVAVAYSSFHLKRRLVVKNIFVGGSWAIIPVGLAVYHGEPLRSDVAFLFVYFTLFVSLAAMICDVQDITGDVAVGIRTIPNVFGPDVTRKAGILGYAIISLLVIIGVMIGLIAVDGLVLLVGTAYAVIYSSVTTTDRSDLFYGFVIDSEHIIVAGILLCMNSAGCVPITVG